MVFVEFDFSRHGRADLLDYVDGGTYLKEREGEKRD